jgi:flavin-binding protein dodecin
MPDRVYKLIEIVGTSTHGSDDAIRHAIEKAAKTVKHMDWFQVIESRGHIADGKVSQFQVVIKVGFRVED